MKDFVLGELKYDYGWSRPYNLEFFGESYPVRLVIPCDEDSDIDSAQRDAFINFEKSIHRLLANAEEAVFGYYQTIRDEYREKLGEFADEKAPIVAEKQEMKKIITPAEVILQESFGSDERIVGLLFDCSWDPALGVAVKIVNEVIGEVGPQDIVL
jgi:hypothetical protein